MLPCASFVVSPYFVMFDEALTMFFEKIPIVCVSVCVLMPYFSPTAIRPVADSAVWPVTRWRFFAASAHVVVASIAFAIPVTATAPAMTNAVPIDLNAEEVSAWTVFTSAAAEDMPATNWEVSAFR